MVIGIDASRANHDEKTGVEWYAWHVIQQLKKITPDHVRVVLYSDEPLRGELADLPPYWESRVLRWPPRRLWTQVRLSFEMLTHPPDVLFVPAHVFPFIHPKKTVMTVHDIAALKFPETYSRFERWYTLWSARAALRKLWRVIVPSMATKKDLSEYVRGGRVNTIVVPLGRDERYCKITDEEKIRNVCQKYGITRAFFLSVGRLEEKKNTWRIVEAFTKVFPELPQPYSLVLIGKPGIGYEKVTEAIARSPYRDHIICPGWIAPEDAVYLMNAAKVFVFPSLYEGFGLPVLEAFAVGTPVIASRGSSLEEVGGKVARYVDALRIEEIAEAMKEMVQDLPERKKMIESGLDRVKQFSWERTARETLGILLDAQKDSQ